MAGRGGRCRGLFKTYHEYFFSSWTVHFSLSRKALRGIDGGCVSTTGVFGSFCCWRTILLLFFVGCTHLTGSVALWLHSPLLFLQSFSLLQSDGAMDRRAGGSVAVFILFCQIQMQNAAFVFFEFTSATQVRLHEQIKILFPF